MASPSKPLIRPPLTPPWASRARPAPTQTEGPRGTPPRPCVGPDHPAGPDTHPPPALAARPRDQLPEEPLPRQGLPATGQDAGPHNSAGASAAPGPGTRWAHRASASGPSSKDVLRLHLPLPLPGSRTPEHSARPRAGLPAQGGPGASRARRSPGLPNAEKLPRHTPRQEPASRLERRAESLASPRDEA